VPRGEVICGLFAAAAPTRSSEFRLVLHHYLFFIARKEEERSAHACASEGSSGTKEDRLSSDPLTPREIGILRLVAMGETNQQIARKLFISVSTVKRHVRHIEEKLGVRDRVQAAVRAVELGLLEVRSGG
jgi:DNA-binding NarL/FixJ family response regulator